MSSDWREGFNRAVLAWLGRWLPEQRPYGDWGTPAEIVSIEEEIYEGFGGSDVTAADDPTILLTITWRNDRGERQVIAENMTLTELMSRLDE